jgi:putative ABC transport system permease protein
MLKNYFKIAIRNINKNGMYSVINIAGLAAGLASFILILLYLNFELSYDKWHPSLKKVYKLSFKNGEDISPNTQAPLGSFLSNNYHNTAATTTIQAYSDFETLLTAGEKSLYQKGIIMADTGFFKVFPYKLLQGDAATALNSPNAIVLSEDLSHKLFGATNPMGKTVKLFQMLEGTVTGILQKPAEPSGLMTELIMNEPRYPNNMHWENFSYDTYIKTRTPIAQVKLENDINTLYFNEHIKKDSASYEDYKKSGTKISYFTDRVSDLHNFPKYGSSNMKTIGVLLLLAVLLLLSGSINFSNLSIAASVRRAKEVGVRKVLGSSMAQLRVQFLIEVAVQCVVSLALAAFIVWMCLPWFRQQFNIEFSFINAANSKTIIWQIAACLLLVILLSGIYPSFFLSKFNTNKVLKGEYSQGNKGRNFRNALIVVQFVLSSFFVLVTFIINRQMNYMQNIDKGFSASQVMRIDASQKTRDDDFGLTKNTLLSLAAVESVSKTTTVPGDKYTDTSTVAFKMDGKEYRMASVKVNSDYFKTLSIGLVSGRNFLEGSVDENTRTAIINQSAAKLLNVKDPIGKFITYPYCDTVPMQIAGIVKDFNVQDFTNRITPVVYTIGNKACMFQSGGALLVKLKPGNPQQTIAGIEEAWKKLEPGFPLRYSFLDDNFQKLFDSYIRVQRIISFFTFIALLISVIGLFALTALLTGQRSKEIGIRKILGASAFNISTLLGKDFLKLVAISTIIAIPLGWWAASKWLDGFAYRTNISWIVFALAIVIIFIIALATISIQVIRVALANPVKSLRTE